MSVDESKRRSKEGQHEEEEYSGGEALEFLRSSWTSLLPENEWPFGLSSFDDLLAPSQVKKLVIVLHELIQAFLKRRNENQSLKFSSEWVEQNHALALQTAIVALEDALDVELQYIRVPKIVEGHKEETISLCQTLETLFNSVNEMDAEARLKGNVETAGSSPHQQPAKQPRKSSLKKPIAAGTSATEFNSFTRSGIQRENPFQSEKNAIYGVGSPGRPGATRDVWKEREAQRRREEKDEQYFQDKYKLRDEEEGAVPSNRREDADYAFLRKRTELPLHKLTRGQLDTARELSFEREAPGSGEPAESPFRSGYAPRASSAQPAGSPFRETLGSGVKAVTSAARASDEHLLSTIDYLEGFLQRARNDAHLRRQTSPWKEHLNRLGGPEVVGRQAAYEDDDYLHGRSPGRPMSARKPGERSYLSSTVGSDPFGPPLPSPHPKHKYVHPDEEFELARLELELFELRRQAAGLAPQHRSDEERERQIDLALENIRDRGDIERSIALLKDYTAGRALPEDRAEKLARSLSEKIFAEEPEHTPKSRIPHNHPHRTGRNHHPAQCIYCKREMDWQSWNTRVIDLLESNFPQKKHVWKTPSKRLYDEKGNVEHGQSRLKPLATTMLEKSNALSHSHAISKDFSGHFLGQLSATERRRAANRLDSLWQVVSGAERDKKAQLHRIAREIDEESFRRAVNMKWLEEQAMERALSKTMVDKQQEREVQKLLQDQARHVATLLDLKRQSLANYTRDQCDMLSERHRLERETQKLRAQNEKHSQREMQRTMREMQEALKQKKLDELRHAEDKFAFRLSELKRPPFSKGGVEDLRYWKTGRT